MSTLHPLAQNGFTAAQTYETHRPSFPPGTVSSLLTHLHIANVPGARVIDLGAGTGKFTELLAAREEGFEILAVEPHVGMRRVLEAKGLRGRGGSVGVLGGCATEMGINRGWADAVVVAQAFHWFANMEALREIHRVLKPAGVLGLVWNIEDYNAAKDMHPSTEWEAKLKEVIWSVENANTQFRHGEWRKIFDDQLKSTPFTIQSADPLFSLPLGEETETWMVWLSKDALWERFHTLSHIAILTGERLEDTKRKVYEAMDGGDVETNEKGELAVHGRTISCWTTAIPGETLKSGG